MTCPEPPECEILTEAACSFNRYYFLLFTFPCLCGGHRGDDFVLNLHSTVLPFYSKTYCMDSKLTFKGGLYWVSCVCMLLSGSNNKKQSINEFDILGNALIRFPFFFPKLSRSDKTNKLLLQSALKSAYLNL